MENKRCLAITKKGHRCKNQTSKGLYCSLHQSSNRLNVEKKDQRLVNLLSVGVSLVFLLEKALEYLPQLIRYLSDGNSCGQHLSSSIKDCLREELYNSNFGLPPKVGRLSQRDADLMHLLRNGTVSPALLRSCLKNQLGNDKSRPSHKVLSLSTLMSLLYIFGVIAVSLQIHIKENGHNEAAEGVVEDLYALLEHFAWEFKFLENSHSDFYMQSMQRLEPSYHDKIFTDWLDKLHRATKADD